MKRILFIAPLYPDRAPSQRFRFEQFLRHLTENGFEYEFSSLVNSRNDKIFYSRGKIFRKMLLLIRFISIRVRDILRANKFDIIFIQREAFFLGTSFFEYCLSKSKAKLIFDFDDSIWLSNVSSANKNLNWLKNTLKTSKIISYSDIVFAGNKYLASYASSFNTNIRIIPTTIDTEEYSPLKRNSPGEKVCIGWSGSITTIEHFDLAVPFLKIIKSKYGDRVEIKVIGDATYRNSDLGIVGIAWNKDKELAELSSFDIGIMPLPDTEWAKGKCGLKGLQYMALQVATVMSPVGVNTEIIHDGENGFLASTEKEWVDKLSLLIESAELRKSLGESGRRTVLEEYSFQAWKDKYVEIFNQILEPKTRILYIAHHRIGRSPGQRFRFEQYTSYLNENGFSIDYSSILSEKDDLVFYSKGKYIRKFIVFIKSLYKRTKDILKASRYDVVIVYRESIMLGTIMFERILARSRARVVFDFDDAIWIKDVSEGNQPLSWLKNPLKTDKIIKVSDAVFAGNEYLANYARRLNSNVMIVPTVIDTDYHSKKNRHENDKVTIGWTGTTTTLKHFRTALGILKIIHAKYGDQVRFKVIVDQEFVVDELSIVASRWRKESEIEDLSEIDIGIMPLPDDEWTKGKCGFKGLQYMAMEIPAIMSPVGVNNEIIEDGINGMLAATDEEWIDKLSLLIESKELREKLGRNGRETVLQKYSVSSSRDSYADLLREIASLS